MTPATPSPRPAYADPAAPADLVQDCRAATRELRLDTPAARLARAALRPAPSLAYDDQPREVRKPEIAVSAAAARLASAIYQD
ncbi:hypothetical protein INN71_16260 [Nocardioides sp. ChNu-153]|uniref:hypothetical protein n=1 Tax=unclassified Nocardioides TaxID=2615069 RepID=UPI002405E0DE|nr:MULTISPECIES: hypothetical protein [unclassified Nocardioides]MDF9715946.1 hypothetical protein [Nocardioides sp. ChNu-99]MDN7122939.1 hypothetical protein [Nocardioides sp. ChNu-153]